MFNKKEIIFFGDVNNCLLSVANMLSKKNYPIKYLPALDLQQHFRIYDFLPLNNYDISNFTEFSNFTIKRSKSSLNVFKEFFKHRKRSDYLLIGCDYAPMVAEFIGNKLDYFVVTGADISDYPRNKFKSIIKDTYQFINRNNILSSFEATKLQRAGIKNSKIISHSDGYFNETLKELIPKSFSKAPFPIIIDPEYDPSKDQLNSEKIFIEKLIIETRKGSNYLIGLTSKISNLKGSPIFIKGFYDFVKKRNSKAKLLLPSRGNFEDIYKSLPIMQELIENGNISVFPILSQRGIYYLSSLVDISFGINYGDISKHDWNTSLVQALQAKSPLITYCPYKTLCDIKNFELYPHFQARNELEVFEGLDYFSALKNRQTHQKQIMDWNHYLYDKSYEVWSNILKN